MAANTGMGHKNRSKKELAQIQKFKNWLNFKSNFCTQFSNFFKLYNLAIFSKLYNLAIFSKLYNLAIFEKLYNFAIFEKLQIF